MNKEGSTYIIIYSSVMVILVAIALSMVYMGLKPRQDKNVEVAKKMDILKSVNIKSTALTAEALYAKYITDTYLINSKGEKIEGNAFTLDLAPEVIKPAEERKLPVYVCTTDNGETKFVLPMRGKGLWGPIWGYISLNGDKVTIYGSFFDHKGETPGLGAEISKEEFQKQFDGKKISENGKVIFRVEKGGAKPGDIHAVDAISGGTITSKGLEAMLNNCLSAYETFLNNK